MLKAVLERLRPLLVYVSANSPTPALVSLPDSSDSSQAVALANYTNEHILSSKLFAFAVFVEGAYNLCLVTKAQWDLLVAQATTDASLIALYENRV
jgi:hypothetical protein